MMNAHFRLKKDRPCRGCNMRQRIVALGTTLVLATTWLWADQVEMQNGDRYLGKVLSLTTDKLVIQSDVLGKLTLPRDKVALITLGATTKTNMIPVPECPSKPCPPRRIRLELAGHGTRRSQANDCRIW